MAKFQVKGEWFWRGGYLTPGVQYEMTDEEVKALRSVGAPLIERVQLHEPERQPQRGRNRGKG